MNLLQLGFIETCDWFRYSFSANLALYITGVLAEFYNQYYCHISIT